ncbi:hypothetical protein, partial [Mycobacterium kiyosense]|uniref:hypothetical protein n=1 Tax=Mycobacterium kiyosense TaxID=2871094 RepID=UPI0035A24CA5
MATVTTVAAVPTRAAGTAGTSGATVISGGAGDAGITTDASGSPGLTYGARAAIAADSDRGGTARAAAPAGASMATCAAGTA